MTKYLSCLTVLLTALTVATAGFQQPAYAKEHKSAQKRMKSVMDQGESDQELETTAAIRKRVIDNESLSVLAKNVNIITKNGLVELNGQVKTSQEAQVIADIAKNTKDVTKVVNNLRVKD